MFFSTWILRTFFDKYGAPISLEQFWMEGYHSMDRMLAQHMFSLENDHIPFPPVAGYAGTTHLYKVKSNIHYLFPVHVIWTECPMMNLVLNVCFDFLADMKIRSERSTNH